MIIIIHFICIAPLKQCLQSALTDKQKQEIKTMLQNKRSIQTLRCNVQGVETRTQDATWKNTNSQNDSLHKKWIKAIKQAKSQEGKRHVEKSNKGVKTKVW